jgi:hypothetical protein
MTPFQRRALESLRDATDTGPGQRGHTGTSMARSLWPDSAAWSKRTRGRVGNRNGAIGGTMPMKGGRVLWDLATFGYASLGNTWTITPAGRRALEES